MRAAIEARLNEIWYHREKPPWYLRSMTPLYRALARADRRRHIANEATDLHGRCIVVVGNLTAGGTGKTPLIIRLCELVQKSGLKPGVISRGYGRADKQQRLVSPDCVATVVGDEPLLIARRSGAPVVVGPSRVDAARALFDKGVDVVLSDDGLQHLRLPRSMEICLVDGERGFGNGHLLPAGPLREEPARLRNVNHVIVNGGSGEYPGPGELPGDIQYVSMNVHANKVMSLAGEMSWRLSQFSGCRVHAVAGIANPERFFELLRQARIDVVEHTFPDHHAYRETDLSGLGSELPLIMTEKDAVKCMGMKLENAWYLSIDAQLPVDWEQAFLRELGGHLDEH